MFRYKNYKINKKKNHDVKIGLGSCKKLPQ